MPYHHRYSIIALPLSLHLTLSSKVHWLAPRRWPI